MISKVTFLSQRLILGHVLFILFLHHIGAQPDVFIIGNVDPEQAGRDPPSVGSMGTYESTFLD